VGSEGGNPLIGHWFSNSLSRELCGPPPSLLSFLAIPQRLYLQGPMSGSCPDSDLGSCPLADRLHANHAQYM
jgi:hypothetical protein